MKSKGLVMIVLNSGNKKTYSKKNGERDVVIPQGESFHISSDYLNELILKNKDLSVVENSAKIITTSSNKKSKKKKYYNYIKLLGSNKSTNAYK